ncbi:MAG TPA: potassium transporter Kup [Magnetospirillum sp.]|nr:potassium transporter Kup [Magnetospirillum sp.]
MADHSSSASSPRRLMTLALGATGVVYGDIGTSPLYALKECFAAHGGLPVTPENVLGIASLIAWALILVVTLKYVSFVMHADNRGEGGIMALLALAGSGRGAALLVVLGLAGSALFYGDGVITPAISVLSAVEGLEVAAKDMESFVLPITLALLVALFAIQKHGTAKVGTLFGPVMVLWFLSVGIFGAVQVVEHPGILAALNPYWAVSFLVENSMRAFMVMGAVVLAVTGGEALYADMGHFGRKPITLAWFGLALPGLMLNYFGQAALVLADPQALENPFYLLVPHWALYPMIALATAATVIASQAVISGVFSLTRQSIQLGFLPRLAIDHTSDLEEGQIYLPFANWALLVAVVALVIGFRSSSALAAAYGIAVTGTMAITTVLALVVAHRQWGWPVAVCLALGAAMMSVDLAFLGSNLLKIPEGGWVPLAIGAAAFTVMITWRRGRAALASRMEAESVPMDVFMRQRLENVVRVPGTAVFMTGSPDVVPVALLHNLKHNKALHERVVFMRVVTESVPRIPARDRLVVEGLADGFYRLTVRYGFFQDPDIPKAMRLAKAFGMEFDLMTTSFFVGHETMARIPEGSMLSAWQAALFTTLTQWSARATDFFCIPPNRVVELGAQVRL